MNFSRLTAESVFPQCGAAGENGVRSAVHEGSDDALSRCRLATGELNDAGQ
ncbi:hypothetical protein [Rhodococcus triatomae]